MWQHVRIEPEDNSAPIDIDRLSTDWVDLEIIYTKDGRFYTQADDNCNQEIFIGWYDDLNTAKRAAEAWLLRQLCQMLNAIGAQGIWFLRGAKFATLGWTAVDASGEEPMQMHLEPPHELILLARFPAGDNGQPGIEHL